MLHCHKRRLAMTADTQSTTLAHLSDVHLAPLAGYWPRYWNVKRTLGWLNWQRKRRFLHTRAAVDALLADIHAAAPGHVVVTGDLVNIGLPAEYQSALAWLRTVGAPDTVSVVPGNHDIYVEPEASRGIDLWSAYMRSDGFGATVAGHGSGFPFVRRIGPVGLVGVNSSCPTAVGYAGGEVGREQRRRLGDILDTLGREGLVRVVAIHHPPKRGLTAPRRALSDAGDLEDVIARHGAELMLHGHNHVESRARIGDTRIEGVASASMCRSYGHEPAARYALIRVNRVGQTARISIETRGLAHGAETVVRSFGTNEFTCGIAGADRSSANRDPLR
jgi:3',5'-cyclic AMP phosphodiesterase CpdA